MAVASRIVPAAPVTPSGVGGGVSWNEEIIWISDPNISVVTYYRMRGIDKTCPVFMQPAYVHWTVEDAPDYTGAELPPAFLPCGSDPLTDVIDIHIEAEWEE